MMTLDELFILFGSGCSTPGCDAPAHYVHGKCHPPAPLWFAVDVARRRLVVACALCRKEVAVIQCPDRSLH